MKNKREWGRVLKFTLFSISAGAIEMASFALLNELLHGSYWPCYLIALTLSVLWNFTLNRKFTFQSANNVPQAMALVLLYYCAFTPLSTLLGSYLADTLHWNEYLVTFLNMVLNLVTEYVYDRLCTGAPWTPPAVRRNSRRRSANRAPIRRSLLWSIWASRFP